MKVLLTTLNAKYIHTNLALRWIYVARDPQFDVSIREYTIRDNLDEVALKITSEKPDILGLSVYIWNQKESKILAQKCKEILPDLRILVGGPEVSYEADDWLDYPIEAVLRGEGEKTFWQACRGEMNIDGYLSKQFKSPIPYAKVDLSYLETLESPYFLDFDNESSKNRYLYIETSRGCPYKCSYCLSSLDNQVRLFSEEYVLTTLNRLETIQCKQVKFLDRTFNVKPDRALQLAKCIEGLNVPFNFQFEVVLDTMTEALLSFFENANKDKYRFEVGVQSFNEKTLESVSRYQNLEKLKTNIKRLSDAGCIMHVDLIGGLPYEDYNSFRKSYETLFMCGASEIQVGILKLLKGTHLRKNSEKYEFDFMSDSPYTIKSTKWCSPSDLMNIENVYHATEKCYNNGRMRYTLDICVSKGLAIFDTMAKIGQSMRDFQGQPQIKDYFYIVYEHIKNEEVVPVDILQALLNTDYYRLFKQSPTPLFNDKIEQGKQKELYKKWCSNHIFDEQILYNYVKIKQGYFQGEICIQAIVYNHLQSYPQIIWFNQEGEKI